MGIRPPLAIVGLLGPMDLVPAFLAALDCQGNLVMANQALLGYAQVSLEEVRGLPLWEGPWWRADPQAQQALRLAVARALTGTTVRLDIRAATARGGRLDLDLTIAPRLGPATGTIGSLVLAGFDVTGRRLAEAEARTRQQDLQELLKAVPAAIWIAHDNACGVLAGNAEAARLLSVEARSPDAGTQASIEHIFTAPYAPCWSAEVADALRAAISAGEEQRGVMLRLQPVGREPVELYGNIVPRLSPEGGLHGAVGAFVDVSGLRKAELHQRQEDQRTGEFIALLSHELRNPLASIASAAAVIRGRCVDSESKYTAQILERQIGNLTRLVDDLLDVSRLAHGQVSLRLERIADLKTLLDDLLSAKTAPGRVPGEHQLTVSAPDTQPLSVLGDTVRLCQAIGNVLDNAFKYTPPAGRIQIALSRRGQRARLVIRDHGIGIAPERLDHVFDLFPAPTDSSAPARSAGLGIGLYLARSLLHLHGGSIAVHSDGPGQGTQVTIELPLIDGALPALPDPVLGEQTGSRVLIADVDLDIAESLRLLLAMRGFDIQVEPDPALARAAVFAFSPDCVLIGVGSYGHAGYALAREVRSAPGRHQPRLIALSPPLNVGEQHQITAAGFDLSLTLPLSLDRLLAELRAPRGAAPAQAACPGAAPP